MLLFVARFIIVKRRIDALVPSDIRSVSHGQVLSLNGLEGSLQLGLM
jgi:hypothetical protein